MQLEIGTIVEGKVTGTTKFGAFVELENGTTGLVHISEISNEYVTEVSDYVKEGDVVKVKVLSIDGNKIGLSIKQTQPRPQAQDRGPRDQHRPDQHRPGGGRGGKRPQGRPQVYRGTPKREEPQTFEDMLSRFKQNSEEKMSDIKRNIDGKRGSYSRKR